MKRRIKYLAIVIFIVILAVLLSFQKISFKIYPEKENLEESIITEDLNHHIVKQTFSINSGYIDGIKVKTATFDKSLEGTLRVTLIKDNTPIASKEINAADIKNNDETDITFNESTKITPGEYTVVFDTTSLEDETPMTFYVRKGIDNNLLTNSNGVIEKSILEMQYYYNGFSTKRFVYLLASSLCLFLYVNFVAKLLRNKN